MTNKIHFNASILILLFLFFCSSVKLCAVPYVQHNDVAVRKKTVVEYKNVNDKLSNNIKEKEVRYFKKVRVNLMNGNKIDGNFLKIENDSLYLVNKELIKMDFNNIDNRWVTAIPLTAVNTIRKYPRNTTAGKAIGFFFLFMGTITLFASSGSNRNLTVGQSIGRFLAGVTFFAVSLITFVMTGLSKHFGKVHIKGNPTKYKRRKIKKLLPSEKK